PLVHRLIQRALSRRKASLVYVDAPTFAGAAATRDPALLRLAGSGVAVAVVRSGDSLATALQGEEAKGGVGGLGGAPLFSRRARGPRGLGSGRRPATVAAARGGARVGPGA